MILQNTDPREGIVAFRKYLLNGLFTAYFLPASAVNLVERIILRRKNNDFKDRMLGVLYRLWNHIPPLGLNRYPLYLRLSVILKRT